MKYQPLHEAQEDPETGEDLESGLDCTGWIYRTTEQNLHLLTVRTLNLHSEEGLTLVET